MRVYELYESQLETLGMKSVFPRSNKLTLRHLNKLNRINKNRKRQQAEKLALVRTMYGDPSLQLSQSEAQLARERIQHDFEMAKQELEQDRLKIQHEIELAKLSDEGRAKVQKMARETLGRRLKD